MNRVRALLVSFLGAAVLMAALSYDAVLWAQDFAAGFPGGGGRGIGLLNALYCQLASPCVLTGDNSGGTGTLRIRPGDNDTQLVLCEASNNSSPEMCSSFNHVNATATSFMQMTTNGYMDSASAWTRFNTSAGTTGIYTQASTTNVSNVIGQVLYSTNNTISGSALFGVTGAGTSTYTIGQNGTVTTDIRGPILNGGSATCNGILAGNLCINDDIALYSANGLITTQATNATAATGLVLYTSGSVNSGALFFGNASVSDADFASKVVMRGVGYPLSMQRTDAVAAGTTVFEVMDNTSATGATLLTVDGDGNLFLNTGATRTKGTITLVAGTGTATVSSGCTPTCSDTTAVNAVQCSVSGTTLTANGTGTDVISYHCF